MCNVDEVMILLPVFRPYLLNYQNLLERLVPNRQNQELFDRLNELTTPQEWPEEKNFKVIINYLPKISTPRGIIHGTAE